MLRVLAVLAGIARGSGGGVVQRSRAQFAVFARESLGEVKRVVWPTRKETMQTTAAVFVFVVVMAMFLWVSDKSAGMGRCTT